MTANSAFHQKFPRCRGMLGMSLVLATFALFFAGCYIARHDVDPQYRSATFSQLPISNQPQLVNIDVEYRVYGMNWKWEGKRLRPKVVRALTSTRAFVESDDSNRELAGQLLVSISPEETPKLFFESIGKGVVTGFTYGLVSTSIKQHFDMVVTYTPPNGQPIVRNYRHSVTTTTGIEAMAETDTMVTGTDLADHMLEDMLVNFMVDFQSIPGQPGLGPATAPQIAAANGAATVARLPPPVTPASATFPQMRPLSDALNLPSTISR